MVELKKVNWILLKLLFCWHFAFKMWWWKMFLLQAKALTVNWTGTAVMEYCRQEWWYSLIWTPLGISCQKAGPSAHPITYHSSGSEAFNAELHWLQPLCTGTCTIIIQGYSNSCLNSNLFCFVLFYTMHTNLILFRHFKSKTKSNISMSLISLFPHVIYIFL